MKIVLITNIPSPYRVLQFDRVAKTLHDDFVVLYCATITSARRWKIPDITHRHVFLKRSLLPNSHWFNPDIVKRLRIINPDVIITSGLFPTCIMAYIYAKLSKKPHIYFTDSWLHSVNRLSKFHRWIRKAVIRHSDAYICVGKKGRDYLLSYGAHRQGIFLSPLAIDNAYYEKYTRNVHNRKYDFIFSGQFIERKMPFFVIDILRRLYELGVRASILLIGSGELQDEFTNMLESIGADYYYPGFIQQNELPKYYSNARILLFPSLDDPWGLVANEACAAGTPVITCKNTGVADDLIRHNENGYVLDLNPDIWASYILELLGDKTKLSELSTNALRIVGDYSVDASAKGIIDACKYVMEENER